MEKLFLAIFNMSMTSCFVIAAIIILRLALKRSPKRYSYLLWLVAAFRLACPISVKSFLSFFNLGIFDFSNISRYSGSVLEYLPENIMNEPEPTIFTGIVVPEHTIFGSSAPSINFDLPQADPIYSANPMQIIMIIASIVWLAGLVLMLLYGTVSFVRLRFILRGAVREEGNVYSSQAVKTPFILGVVRPRIYIPEALCGETRQYVLAHERHHIKRRDHLVKLIAFLLVAVHWFNPLCWVAFLLMTKDMEMSCDEWVISEYPDIKASYSETLLSFACKKGVASIGMLGFGESAVALRIKNVLKWKKPRRFAGIASIILTAVFLIACATNPTAVDKAGDIFGKSFGIQSIVYEDIYSAFTHEFTGYTEYNVTDDSVFFEKSGEEVAQIGELEEVRLSSRNFDRFFDGGDWSDFYSVETVRRTTKYAWRIKVKNSEKNDYYLLLQSKNGEFYIAYGFDAAPKHLGEAGKDKPYILWMFKLKVKELQSRLYAVECVYEDPLGPSDFDGFNYEYYFTADEFSVFSLGGKNILTAEITEGWKPLEYDDEQWKELFWGSAKPDISKYSVRQQMKLSGRYTLLNMDGDFWLMSLDTDYESKVRAREIYRLSYASRGMTLTDTASDGALTQLISETILEQYRSYVPETLIYHESHKVFDIETVYGDPKKGSGEKIKLTKVYIELLYGAFGFVNGELCDMHYGGHTPAVLTFKVNESEHYECVAFETPESGRKYGDSVKELFPEHLHEQVLDASDDSFLSLMQSSYKKAIEATATDPNLKIERLINVIMSSPLTSSVPADYIDANPIEYRELLYLGEYTLKYVCESFKEGGKNGLEGHIMRALLDELTFNEIKISDPEYKLETGQDYFDEWAKELKNLAQRMPNGELQAKFPALWQAYRYIYD